MFATKLNLEETKSKVSTKESKDSETKTVAEKECSEVKVEKKNSVEIALGTKESNSSTQRKSMKQVASSLSKSKQESGAKEIDDKEVSNKKKNTHHYTAA